MSRRSLSILLSAVVLVLLAAWPTGASAAEKAIWGPTHLPNGNSAFERYRDLGVDAYQTDIRWNSVAPRRPSNPRDPADPAYRWPSSLDFVVNEGRRLGISITPMVIGSPRWANGGRDFRWAPTHDRDYADFLVAVSRRYPSIRRWQIWGEPSHPGAFQPGGNPTAARRYARLLDRAYGALKAVNRKNIVIGGMTFTYHSRVTPIDFLRDLRLPSGSRPRLDWWGHNPFSRRYPDGRSELYKPEGRDINDMDVFANEVRRAYPGRGVKLWLSEFTIQSDHGSRTFNFYVSKKDQAAWITAAFRLANRQSSIAGLGWLALLDEAPRPDRLEKNWGLMTYRGVPKPAYSAYRNVP